jgi:hypothetical protein
MPLNTPRTPLPSPFDLSRKHRLAAEESLAEVLPLSRHLRSIATPTVSPSHSLTSYPLLYPLAPLLILLVHTTMHQIKQAPRHPKLSSARGPPVATLLHLRKRSTKATKHPSSPCCSEAHRSLAIIQNPLQPRRRRPPPCLTRILDGTLT